MLLALAAGGCSGGDDEQGPRPTDPLARVGSKTIVRADLQGQPATRGAVKGLVEAEWLRQELAAAGMHVAEAAVQDPGRSAALIRSLLRERADASPDITAHDIKAYYLEHTELFKEPERREVRVILLATRRQAEAAVANSDLFIGLLGTRSIRKEASGAAHAGAFFVLEGELPPALDRAVFAAGFGGVNGPVKAPKGWWVFEVHDSYIDALRQKLSEVRDDVVGRIRAERRNPTAESFRRELEREYAPHTRCLTRVCADALSTEAGR